MQECQFAINVALLAGASPEALKKLTTSIECMLGESIAVTKVYVCEDNGIIKAVGGFSQTFQDDATYNLFGCYVHPDFQNQKIGKLLTEFRMREIEKRGGRQIFATTKKPYHLERFGFVQIASPYPDKCVLQKCISAQEGIIPLVIDHEFQQRGESVAS